MYNKHRLGMVNTDTFCYSNWQNLLKPASLYSEVGSDATLLANGVPSNKFWQVANITSKDKQHVLKYRTDTIHTAKHAHRFNPQNGPANCPLCGAPDSSNHILLRCNHPTLQQMHINRHHLAVSLCGTALSQGDMGSSFITMDDTIMTNFQV